MMDSKERIIYDELEVDEYDQEFEFELVKEDLGQLFGDNLIVLSGTLGLWNRTPQVAAVCRNVDELFQKVSLNSMYYTKIYENKGHLYIDIAHHDGTNTFEVKKANDAGNAYYRKHENDYDRSNADLAMAMFKRYSVLPKYYG